MILAVLLISSVSYRYVFLLTSDYVLAVFSWLLCTALVFIPCLYIHNIRLREKNNIPLQGITTNMHHCLAESIGKGTTNRCKLQAVWRSKRISDDLHCWCYHFDCSHLKKMDSLWAVLEYQQHETDSHQQQFMKMSCCWPWQNHFCIQECCPRMQGSR